MRKGSSYWNARLKMHEVFSSHNGSKGQRLNWKSVMFMAKKLSGEQEFKMFPKYIFPLLCGNRILNFELACSCLPTGMAVLPFSSVAIWRNYWGLSEYKRMSRLLESSLRNSWHTCPHPLPDTLYLFYPFPWNVNKPKVTQ